MDRTMIEKEFKVGDRILVTPRFGNPYTLTVTRLTKTQAVCEWIRKTDGMKLSEKFRKTYHTNGEWCNLTPVPLEEWPTNTYKVIEK